MATLTLVTGVPGAGKTLYSLHELVRPLVGTFIEHEGVQVERRIVVGNVRDLVLPHEPMAMPTIDPESFKEPHPDLQRDPGDEAHAIEMSVTSWWLWCKPGDVIVVDECQRSFRPFASGRRVPQYIAKLETARHYGVEFIFITQHPQLLHLNVRNLVGRHLHVRRLFAGMQTIVYEWDHCTHPDRVKNATATPWRHKSAAYGLYKSAEVHTKGKARIPLAIFVFVAALVALPVAFWYAKSHLSREKAPKAAPAQVDPSPTTGTPEKNAPRAVFVAAIGTPAFADAVKPRHSWPEAVAGCWAAEGEPCKCITQEMPPRVIVDRQAMCLAVVMGDLVPPESHQRPERTEPTPAAPAAAASEPQHFGQTV